MEQEEEKTPVIAYNPNITLGDIVQTIFLLGAMAVAYASLTNKQVDLEARIAAQERHGARMQLEHDRIADTLVEIQKDTQRKLDTLNENVTRYMLSHGDAFANRINSNPR